MGENSARCAAHLCFYVHVWDHDENWRIKSTQPPSTKVSQRMTAFFFLLLLLLILCPPTRRRCCRFSWSIQQQHWQQQQLRRWQYHMTPECMSRTAFSIYCDASWISCGRPKFNCFVFFPAAPRSFSSFPRTHTHSHTQKVQYQMATSVEYEIMSMSRVARGTE